MARRRPRSPSRPTPNSKHRILAAATALFAERGFAATSVDRIAARARLNKAMIYYHFHSKHELYRAVLREIFAVLAAHLAAIAASADPPAHKLDRFVETLVAQGTAHPHLAPIMLREVAEGGRRLDEETYTAMVHIVRIVSGIVDQGREEGQFAPVDPLLLYLTTVWPVLVYLTTAPIRRAVARVAHVDPARLDPERFVAHLQQINRRAVLAPAALPTPSGVTS